MAGFLFRKHLYICLINVRLIFSWIWLSVACCEVCDIFCFKVYENIVQLKFIYTLKAFILLAFKIN